MKVDFSGDEIKIYDFNALESFRIAKRLESEGIKLYREIQERLPDGDIKEVMRFLLGEEKNHLDFFEKQINELAKSGEVENDLVDIVDPGVISPISAADNIDEIINNRQEAVKLGIIIEQRSIAFYESIIQNTEDPDGKEALLQIIDAERKHEAKLQALLGK